MRVWVFGRKTTEEKDHFHHCVSRYTLSAWLSPMLTLTTWLRWCWPCSRPKSYLLPPPPAPIPPVPFGRKLIFKKGIYAPTSLRCSSLANYLEFFCKGHWFLLPQFIQNIYLYQCYGLTDILYFVLSTIVVFFFFFRLFQLWPLGTVSVGSWVPLIEPPTM